MILEIVVVCVISAILGALLMKLLLKNDKFAQKIDRSEAKKYAAMRDPELLLQKLNKNGVMVDDGDEISFKVEDKNGKKVLVQEIKKGAAQKGTPKVSDQKKR